MLADVFHLRRVQTAQLIQALPSIKPRLTPVGQRMNGMRRVTTSARRCAANWRAAAAVNRIPERSLSRVHRPRRFIKTPSITYSSLALSGVASHISCAFPAPETRQSKHKCGPLQRQKCQNTVVMENLARNAAVQLFSTDGCWRMMTIIPEGQRISALLRSHGLRHPRPTSRAVSVCALRGEKRFVFAPCHLLDLRGRHQVDIAAGLRHNAW